MRGASKLRGDEPTDDGRRFVKPSNGSLIIAHTKQDPAISLRACLSNQLYTHQERLQQQQHDGRLKQSQAKHQPSKEEEDPGPFTLTLYNKHGEHRRAAAQLLQPPAGPVSAADPMAGFQTGANIDGALRLPSLAPGAQAVLVVARAIVRVCRHQTTHRIQHPPTPIRSAARPSSTAPCACSGPASSCWPWS